MTQAPNRTLAAFGAVLIYACVIAYTDNYVRVIARDAGLWQFHATRTVMAIAILAVLAIPLGLRLRPRRPKAVLARSAIHGAAMVIYFGALAFLPYAARNLGFWPELGGTASVFLLLGFMTLSLIPRLMHEMYTVGGIKLAINYGLNKVRFPSPVPVGSKVRATSTLVDAEDVGNDTVQLTVSTVIEIEGAGKPACVAESVLRYIGG